MVALLMRGTLPTGPQKQLREPFALGVAPPRRQGTVGRRLCGLQRVVDDPRPRFGEDDQREAGVAVVRLAGNEPDPLERSDLAGDARRRDAEALRKLGAAQLLSRLAAQLA